MERYFNTTGLCNPEQHYMVPPFRGLYDEVYRLIEVGQYFLIHAPRQTGKTTFLHEFAHKLNREGKYACVVFSVKNAGAWDEIDEKLCEVLNEAARNLLPNKLLPARSEIAINFGDYVSDWVAGAFFLPFFSREEVRGLLDQHTADTGQVFSDEVFERIFYYSGRRTSTASWTNSTSRACAG